MIKAKTPHSSFWGIMSLHFLLIFKNDTCTNWIAGVFSISLITIFYITNFWGSEKK